MGPQHAPEFPSERPIAAHITREEILEEPMLFEQNILGNYIARYFASSGRTYGLGKGAFQDLRRLADQVAKSPWVNVAVGRTFIEDSIFLWCRETFQSNTQSSLADYLLKRSAESVKGFSVWVPIAYLEVEQLLEFGPVKIAPITASMLNDRENYFIEKSPARADKIRVLHADMRQRYQGLAAVVIDLEAESHYATERGMELAGDVIGLLRIYSPAAYTPWLVCPCAIIGSEYVPSTVAISYGAEDSFRMSQSVLKPLPYPLANLD